MGTSREEIVNSISKETSTTISLDISHEGRKYGIKTKRINPNCYPHKIIIEFSMRELEDWKE